MKGRKQKISQDNCRQKNRTESEACAGVQTFIGITENRLTEVQFTKDGLLERILSPGNLQSAYKRVKQNGGSGGVDQMEAEALLPHLQQHQDALITSILEGRYRPGPVRRAEIPKNNGKTRSSGIPTVVDRFIQQAIAQVLSPIYEKEFSDNSYGFRPGRSCPMCLRRAQSHVTAGYQYVVDIDLEKFFDTVNQQKLIEILSGKIKDGRVIPLIHKYMRAGAVVSHQFEESECGVPQGGNLSPLLSNIMLNELDKELERRGHPFVRYADDGLIFCKSKRAAERTQAHTVSFIEKKLFLKVNREKTQTGHVRGMKFLGHSFYVNKGECRLCVHPKSVTKMKNRLKELTCRSNGWSYERRKAELKACIMGWVEYFKYADMKQLLRRTDEWLRRRIRMCIWKSWKKVKTRYRNLLRCGLDRLTSWMCANNSKGCRYVSGSSNLNRALNNDHLRKAGYLFMGDYYRKVTS